MKKLKKLSLCLSFIFVLGIGTASAKMFGHDCSYTISFGANGCEVTYTTTAYYFWIPDTNKFVVGCDWGGAFDLCDTY